MNAEISVFSFPRNNVIVGFRSIPPRPQENISCNNLASLITANLASSNSSVGTSDVASMWQLPSFSSLSLLVLTPLIHVPIPLAALRDRVLCPLRNLGSPWVENWFRNSPPTAPRILSPLAPSHCKPNRPATTQRPAWRCCPSLAARPTPGWLRPAHQRHCTWQPRIRKGRATIGRSRTSGLDHAVPCAGQPALNPFSGRQTQRHSFCSPAVVP
jgi:hypothetical protein